MSKLREESNKMNYLKRVIKIQTITKEVWKEDMTYKFIWRHHIHEQFNIEYNTYIRILNEKKPKEQLENLETKINDRKTEFEMKKMQSTLFALAALALLMASCNNANKLAQKCAEQYPCKDSLTVRETTRTDTVELTDTYIEYIDTTVCPPSTNGVTLIDTDTVWLKGQKIVITRTVRDSTWWRLDQAALAAMQQDLEQADAAIAKLITEKAVVEAKLKTAHKHNCWLWVVCVVLGIFVLLLFWRRIQSAVRNPKSAIM